MKVDNNNDDMMDAIVGRPVAVAVNASGYAFKTYKSGVLKGNCSNTTNHAVVIIGYNTTNPNIGGPYWRVRNSWGASWGNDGFINMTQNGGYNGMCGINSQVTYPKMIFRN